MVVPLCASILVAFTSVLVFTSDNPNWPLVRLGQTYGILVLNILSILSGLLLKSVIDQGFDSLKWGPLLARGMYLNVFLAMSSSTWPKGWWSVFFWNPQTLKTHWVKWFKRSKKQDPPTVIKTGPPASAKRVQDKSRRQARIWSFVRYVRVIWVTTSTFLLTRNEKDFSSSVWCKSLASSLCVGGFHTPLRMMAELAHKLYSPGESTIGLPSRTMDACIWWDRRVRFSFISG